MNTSKKTQLALVYIRYSSHAQDNGNSPAAQMTCAENYTEAHRPLNRSITITPRLAETPIGKATSK